MQPPSVQAVGDSNSPLLLMPAELLIKTFCLLPSFSDVFVLAATCQRLRRIWTANVTAIYSQVAPRSIPCERHARSFLADQGGPAIESPTLSAGDVVRMLRNSCVVEKAILQFEREIVPKVRASGFPLGEYYGAGARKHPPNLTRTERPRFIRSYYQLWGMMKLDAAEWQSRLEPMKLKHLYYLCEMSKLTQSIGREEVLRDPDSVHARLRGRSKERIALGTRIWEHIEHTYQRIHNEGSDFPWAYAKHEGFMWFVVMWDHWQGSLKQVVCGGPRPSLEKQYLWDDSSDEQV